MQNVCSCRFCRVVDLKLSIVKYRLYFILDLNLFKNLKATDADNTYGHYKLQLQEQCCNRSFVIETSINIKFNDFSVSAKAKLAISARPLTRTQFPFVLMTTIKFPKIPNTIKLQREIAVTSTDASNR